MWFYGQLVCTLWCIFLHRNEVIFNRQRANPTKVLLQQKSLFHWIDITANKKGNHRNCRKPSSLSQAASPDPTHPPSSHHEGIGSENPFKVWQLFIEVKRIKGKEWFGASSVLRSPSEFGHIMCKSIQAANMKQAKVLFLQEVIVRAKEFDVKHIQCRDHKRDKENYFRKFTPICWEYIQPLLILFCSLRLYRLLSPKNGVHYAKKWGRWH